MIDISEKRKLYMGAYDEDKGNIDTKIAEGIEKYRKGHYRMRFVDKNGNSVAGKKVKLTQKTHDFKYGANIFMLDEFESEEDNLEYRRFFKEYFNLATVPFYWDGLEAEEGNPRYDKNSKKVYRRPSPDLCMNYCEENGVTPKLHCLVYDKFTPEWLQKLPLEEVKKKYEERFRQIAERYSGRMYEFEVINELLLEKDWTQKTKLSDTKDIIEWSFNLAQKYFPDEVLVINEGNPIPVLSRDDYRNPYYMMIENSLQKGTKIDKIGLQNHMFTGATARDEEQYEKCVRNFDRDFCNPKSIWKGLDIISELGLPLELTEVTIPTLGDTIEDEELQADMLKLWYSVWFSHPAVEGIVYWNTIDGYAYDDGKYWNENNCRGGLWHHDLTPKKSAEMLKTLFSKEWRTDLELITDKDGYIDFRGFYGEYEVTADGKTNKFGIHKNENNGYNLEIQKWKNLFLLQ